MQNDKMYIKANQRMVAHIGEADKRLKNIVQGKKTQKYGGERVDRMHGMNYITDDIFGTKYCPKFWI